MEKKVLFTASTFSHIVNFHRPYLRALREAGWTVHVACGGECAALAEADEVIALPFEKKMTAPGNFRAQAQLRKLMRDHAYSLVVTHTSLAAFFTRRAAAPLHPRPAVVNVAHGYLFDDATPLLKRTVLLAAEKLTARQTDLLLTMNDYDFRTAQAHRLGARVEAIPGIGVDFARLDGVPAADRTAFGFAPDDYILIYAAEFSSRKNQSMLLRALPKLPERVKLLLPGSGALLKECRALAEQLGVSDRAVFPGQRRDMAALYAMADAAVSASRSEGLPFNIMEAMYCGLPAVASRVKGHTELVAPGETGFLYDYDDAEGFCTAVEKLLDDPGAAAAMGAAGRKAVQPYALERVQPLVMEKYLSAFSQKEQ